MDHHAARPPQPDNLQLAVLNCRKARWIAQSSILACAVGQLIIEASAKNYVCVLITAITSIVTFHLLIRGSVFRTLPLPALVVLGFNIATMSGALVAQTLSLRPLVFNLNVPEVTFSFCALFQVSLLIPLYLLISSPTLRAASRFINVNVYSRMGIMQAPSTAQLWILGLIGVAATALTGSLEYSGNIHYGDTGLKFLIGLRYLSFAPFLIPILKYSYPSSNQSSIGKSFIYLLIGYFILLVFVAIIRNSRGAFSLGIANLGITLLLLILMGQLKVSRGLRRRLAAIALLFLAATPILSDLSVAMLIVRSQRTQISSFELLNLTLSEFNDKQALDNYRKAGLIIAGIGEYEENYLSNPFIARFIQTKYFDNSLSYKDAREGRHADYLWDITINKLIAILPTPFLQVLGINLNKEDFELSIGDALYYTYSNTGHGGFRTGSPIGHGYGLIGPLVFIAAIPIFLLTFIALQSLTVSIGQFVVISPVILLQIISIYNLSARDSLLDPFFLMLRGLPQDIIVYWLGFHGIRWLGALNPLSNTSPFRKINAL